MTDRSATTPYDWDNYEADFQPNRDYEKQEAALVDLFRSIRPVPQTILEVGPGLGRITKLLVETFPEAHFTLYDVSSAAIDKSAAAAGLKSYAAACGQVQDEYMPKHLTQMPPIMHFDLVVAIEVLMHVPPDEVEAAARNLVAVGYTGSHMITCDWTRPLRSDQQVRVMNYRHDYYSLFRYVGCKSIMSQPTGFQTIFVVEQP